MGLLPVFKTSAAPKGYSKLLFFFCKDDFECRITVKHILQTMHCSIMFCSARDLINDLQFKLFKIRKTILDFFILDDLHCKPFTCYINGLQGKSFEINQKNIHYSLFIRYFFLFWTIYTANRVNIPISNVYEEGQIGNVIIRTFFLFTEMNTQMKA